MLYFFCKIRISLDMCILGSVMGDKLERWCGYKCFELYLEYMDRCWCIVGRILYLLFWWFVVVDLLGILLVEFALYCFRLSMDF